MEFKKTSRVIDVGAYGELIGDIAIEASKIAFQNQDTTPAQVAIKLWENYKEARDALVNEIIDTGQI